MLYFDIENICKRMMLHTKTLKKDYFYELILWKHPLCELKFFDGAHFMKWNFVKEFILYILILLKGSKLV